MRGLILSFCFSVRAVTARKPDYLTTPSRSVRSSSFTKTKNTPVTPSVRPTNVKKAPRLTVKVSAENTVEDSRSSAKDKGACDAEDSIADQLAHWETKTDKKRSTAEKVACK